MTRAFGVALCIAVGLVCGSVSVGEMAEALEGVALDAATAVPSAEVPEAAEAEAGSRGERGSRRGASFAADRTVVGLDVTSVLAFSLDPVGERDRRFRWRVEPAGVVEVISPPMALAGREWGYLRLRGVGVGEATVHVGEASMVVGVVEDVAYRALHAEAPRITGIVPGAVIWGEIGVGVELFDEVGGSGAEAAEVVLLASDGSEAAFLDEMPAGWSGPTRQLAFTLNADALPAGPVDLVAVAKRAGRPALTSEAVPVFVVRPEDGTLIEGEAEDLAEVVRPERYGLPENQRPLNVSERPGASGGRAVINNSANPPMTIPVSVAEAGWYQLILRVEGDHGGSAHATVGLRINNAGNPVTGGRLVTEQWHRLAIGRPVRLEAGEQSLVAYYENDFNVRNVTDRNLRIDRYELLRMEEAPLPRLGRAAVAMEPTLHGRTIGGGISVRGAVRGLGRLAPTPEVALVINGEAIAVQRSSLPRFEVDRGHMVEGENTFVLEARFADGVTVRSPEQVATLVPHDGGTAMARRMMYFAMDDGAWRGSRPVRDQDRDGVHAFFSNGRIVLHLPEDLEGEFDLGIEARGDSYDGPPIARVTRIAGEDETVVGEIGVGGGFAWRDVGRVALERGDKQLTLAFTNDKYDGAPDKDRNLFVAALLLHERVDADTSPPAVAIVYPEDGAAVYAADAVVIDATDDRGVAWAEVLIDGRGTGVRLPMRDGSARATLPLLLRGVEPGDRRIAVRVADEAGNRTTSQPRIVRVLGDAPTEPTAYERAVRVLDRFAFGPDADELAAVLTMGVEPYLRDRLSLPWEDPAEQAAWAAAVAAFPDSASGGQVERRVLRHAMTTPNPVRTRFVLWSNNHFSTWMRKTGAARKAHEFESLAAVGPASMQRLLYTSATSPAMLFYLDQHRSYARRINENYAREIMELHSLGVNGGYTQEDVTELSHLLTGWMISDEAPLDGSGRMSSEYRFCPPLNDPRARVVLGMTFPETQEATDRFDRVRTVIEMLAAHPSTARHISRKLVEHYVSMPADDQLVDDVAGVFMRSGGDFREALLAIAIHPAFDRADAPQRVTQPFDFAVRLARATGHNNANQLHGYLARSVSQVFDRDTPDGYPQNDDAYTDSNMTLQRWRLAREIEWSLFRLAPGPLRGDPPDGVDGDAWRQQLIDAVAVQITGRTLGDRSNDAAMKVLRETELTGNDRVLLITGLIAQLPEAILR